MDVEGKKYGKLWKMTKNGQKWHFFDTLDPKKGQKFKSMI